MLVQEHPEARHQAVTTVGEAYQALDRAVRGDGDLVASYIGWVDASVRAWEIDEGLARMRRFHGEPTRDVATPAFNFGVDVGSIIDAVGFELQDQAIARIDARRQAYLAGKSSS